MPPVIFIGRTLGTYLGAGTGEAGGEGTGVAGGGVRNTELWFAVLQIREGHCPQNVAFVSHRGVGDEGVMDMFGIRGRLWSNSARVVSPVSSCTWEETDI